MLEDVVKDYAIYFKLDVSSGFQTVQDVIDNMLTRLEELTSVLLMIKLKNSDCSISVTEDISKYRSEINILSKKIITLNDIILKLIQNVDVLEKQIERAETDFGVNTDNKLKSFLKPLLMRTKEIKPASTVIISPEMCQFHSVLDNFEDR